MTVEDPLEFAHKDKTAIITQREVGHDTLSFANALRGALRTGGGCLSTCPRQNAVAINDWSAHVIHRHKDPAQIVKEHQEALRKP